MSTHNICFRRDIREILSGYPLLSVAMGKDLIFDYFTFSPRMRLANSALLMTNGF